jgi:hypothetical protein
MLTSLMYLALAASRHDGQLPLVPLIFVGLALWRVVRFARRRRYSPWI